MIARPKDALAGGVFILAGTIAFVAAQQYEVGTANHMGPGYLPALMGVVLVILGAFSLLTALRSRQPEPLERTSLEPFVLVVTGVVAFALLIDTAGFFVALFALIFIACYRHARKHPVEAFAIYLGLAAFCVGVFRFALDLPLPLGW